MREKIPLREFERDFILNERKQAGYTAERASETIGRSKSWLAQIENGRTGSISRTDFIKLISLYRNEPDEKRIEGYISSYMYSVTHNLMPPETPYDKQVDIFISNRDITDEGLDESLKNVCDGFANAFSDIYNKAKNKKNMLSVFNNILYHIKYCDTPFVLGFMDLPIDKLASLNPPEKIDFLKEVSKLIMKYGENKPTPFDMYIQKRIQNIGNEDAEQPSSDNED